MSDREIYKGGYIIIEPFPGCFVCFEPDGKQIGSEQKTRDMAKALIDDWVDYSRPRRSRLTKYGYSL